MSVYQRVAASQEWKTFTPSWTNLTVGNAPVKTGRYMYLADTCMIVRFQITLGSTSSVGSTPYFDLPNSADGVLASGLRSHGPVVFVDATGTDSTGLLVHTAGSSRLYPFRSNYAGINATAPFTWASGDIMHGQIMLEVNR